VMRYMPKTMSREESSQQLSQFIRHWQERGFGLWAVEEKGSGAFIGRIGLMIHDDWPERKSGSPTSENSTSTHSGE
jgi:[ribosomal protein S5]-alanine N-acetyltransferase